ncbi:precorrin-2 dehydrogenase/sirohydrochlorin ferrochelatase family protein [Sphingobacterium haloxyli]|uniref:precorrin-2 dehydrogenase n=1 Tax=Sphingobacterium haloxyli TaxID=2100533 RepID=A0A2S9J2U9_9SPHI|nr:bifunctional precorrin-2 dehydrogenase/sirohydrochlorin ferrochelatase [Sphingobacterium haloxyli]PRD47070.1 siroheme synthase [Sphingobacterium haloxyli]
MNELFPIYVKLHQIQTLLVGAGNVGLEKLEAILANSPLTNLHIVATNVSSKVYELVSGKENIKISERAFSDSDINDVDLIILATNNAALNAHIRQLATTRHILLNVADKPALCDFYLGSVVSKGNLKIGISTNGKSPTMAKRIKEFLNDLLPEEIDETLELMGQLRDNLTGDFQEKVRVLNAHTKDVLNKKSYDSTN